MTWRKLRIWIPVLMTREIHFLYGLLEGRTSRPSKGMSTNTFPDVSFGSLLKRRANVGVWLIRRDICWAHTHYPCPQRSNRSDQVTITSPISPIHMPITSTLTFLHLSSSPASLSPISTCSKHIRPSTITVLKSKVHSTPLCAL